MRMRDMERPDERLAAMKADFDSLVEALDVDGLQEEAARLEKAMESPDFWQKSDADETVRRLKALRVRLEAVDEARRALADAGALIDILREEDDEDLTSELAETLARAETAVRRLRVRLLLRGEHDMRNAYLSIHAGAGGDDACDWVQMLLRTYLRYLERAGFKTTVVDVVHAEEAGIKSVTVHVVGRYAYGLLRGEHGVHRLVRISPFDAAHRRHTSFAAVEVLPEFDEDIEVDLREEDLKVDTFRSSGPGGQHVNVTDSAVRITHVPTGIVVSCQNERSQHANRRVAMQILKAKIYQVEQERRRKEIDRLRGPKGDASWGNQIRSYVLHPYTLVKDHRTDLETSNVQSVLDGALDDFVDEYLHWDLKRRGTGTE